VLFLLVLAAEGYAPSSDLYVVTAIYSTGCYKTHLPAINIIKVPIKRSIKVPIMCKVMLLTIFIFFETQQFL